MIQRKKLIMILLAATLMTASACSSKSGNTGETGGASAGTPPSSAASGDSVGAEADPFGKYPETVTINIGKNVDPTDKSLPAGDTPESNQYTRYIQDKLNILTKVEWQAANGPNYDQKVNLAIASNDLPDAMVVNDAQLRQMVKAGQLEDLGDAYNKFASPVMKSFMDKTEGISMKSVTFDGKMLALPNISPQADGAHLMWVRKDWLDQLSLQPPKTVAELEAVAKAFVENDPDGNGKPDTIGISGPQSGGNLYATFLASTNNMFGFDPIFESYHAYPGFWLKGADGNPVYGSTLPETKEALSKLRDMYAQGMIDREMSVRKDATEPIVSGKSGIFFGPWWGGYHPLPDAIKNNQKANWQAYAAPLDADGKWIKHMGTPSNAFIVVRKGYEHPEAVIKMMNILIRDEQSFDVSVGVGNYPIRIVQAALDEVEFTLTAIRKVLAGTEKPDDYKDHPYKLIYSDVQNITKAKKEPYDNMDISTWDTSDIGIWSRMYSLNVGGAPLLEPYDKVYSMIYSQTKTMESKWANLKKLEDETFLKIIMGAAPIDSFDKFVTDWKRQGGDDVIKEVAETVKQ